VPDSDATSQPIPSRWGGQKQFLFMLFVGTAVVSIVKTIEGFLHGGLDGGLRGLLLGALCTPVTTCFGVLASGTYRTAFIFVIIGGSVASTSIASAMSLPHVLVGAALASIAAGLVVRAIMSFRQAKETVRRK
jgi:hypothetical protein